MRIEGLSLAALWLVARRNGLEYHRLEDFFSAADRQKIEEFLKVGRGFYYRPDPDLGWTIRPSTHVAAAGTYQATTSNGRGLRSLREYAPEAPPGVLRVAAFGDSFVHGDEVDDQANWPAVLERSRPDLEVLNFGASGYGPDQALLRWERDGSVRRSTGGVAPGASDRTMNRRSLTRSQAWSIRARSPRVRRRRRERTGP